MSNTLQVIIFSIIAFISIFGAGAVIFKKNLVHAAISFLFSFLAIAGLYFMLNADFIGIAQIMIYSVGITLIMLFAIMLTNRAVNIQLVHHLTLKNALTALSIMVITGFLIFGIIVTRSAQNSPEGFAFTPVQDITKLTIMEKGTTGLIGQGLFTSYILPFELLSILLLIAMIGALVLAKKHFTGDLSNPSTKHFNQELSTKTESHTKCSPTKNTEPVKEKVGVS